MSELNEKALADGYQVVAPSMSYGIYRAAVRAYESVKAPPIIIARLKESGVARVLNGKVGMVFVVDSFGGVDNKCAHVIDYRYLLAGSKIGFQTWTIGEGGYEIL